YFANSQFGWAHITQIADITGVLGISFLLVLGNVAIFSLMKRRGWKPAACAIVLVATALVYGHFRMGSIEQQMAEAKKLKVGMVQANIGMYEKHRDPRGAHDAYRRYSRELEEKGVELLVWPETAVTDPWLSEGDAFVPLEFEPFSVPLLTGMLLVDPSTQPTRDYNVAALIHPDRRISGIYRKQVLLMFGEYLPFGEYFPQMYDWLPTVGQFTPGKDSLPISWNGMKIGTTICYEDILPRLVRRIMQHDPMLLTNLTNDSWFGDSTEPAVHLALATFRTIEHRRAMVRSTNTGISAFIDPLGRIVAKAPQYEAATLIGEVPLMTGTTLYTRFGDWLGWISILGVIIMIITPPTPSLPCRQAGYLKRGQRS
ncbi:MAG: apolipoprotein N-acyltransferase, partial [Deltaproteobacteria bacterium]|nr:apolipoprotein N-acyltransferase [Deltaproteobacteria bacterium]